MLCSGVQRRSGPLFLTVKVCFLHTLQDCYGVAAGHVIVLVVCLEIIVTVNQGTHLVTLIVCVKQYKINNCYHVAANI